MSMIDELLRALPTDQLAQAVGADEQATTSATRAALPAILAGLAGNAQHQDGAQSLLTALNDHQNDLADNPSLDRIDPADGQKILGHIFGGNTDSVVNQLGGLGSVQSSGLVQKLLPILAPLVLSWLAKQVGGAASQNPQAQAPQGQLQPGQAQAGGMDLTSILQDVLGSALGGATGRQPQTQTGSGGILGDVLGGLLGGRR